MVKRANKNKCNTNYNYVIIKISISISKCTTYSSLKSSDVLLTADVKQLNI